MNGVRALTVKSAASGDRVQRSFLSDRSLSGHLLHTHVNFSVLSVCNRRNVRLIFWRLGKHIVSDRLQPDSSKLFVQSFSVYKKSE